MCLLSNLNHNPDLLLLPPGSKAFSLLVSQSPLHTSLPPNLLHRHNSTAVILVDQHSPRTPHSTHLRRSCETITHTAQNALCRKGGTSKTWPSVTCPSQTLCNECLKFQAHPSV